MHDPGNPHRFDGPPILGLTKYESHREKDPHRFDGTPIVRPKAAEPAAEQRTVEVCRSFAYKLSLGHYRGGKQYESADFFASRKTTAGEEDVAWVSQQIFEDCVDDVRSACKSFIVGMAARADNSPVPAVAPSASNSKNFEAWKAKQNGESPL